MNLEQEGLLLPLWLKFPWISRYSIGWRMGAGEAYGYQWSEWLEGLSEEEIRQYKEQFPEPKSWRGFWQEYGQQKEAELPEEYAYFNEFHTILFWEKNGQPVYSLPELLKKQGKNKFIFFWGHTPEKDKKLSKACLSQWWMADFRIDETNYCCMEQYLMAEKARLFGDKPMEQKILNSGDPREIKALGRKVSDFDEKVWNACRYSVALNGNYYKFLQNPELWKFLNQTGDNILVEASPYDTIWGIGMSGQKDAAAYPEQWKGKNLLGFALTEVREELRRVLGVQDSGDKENEPCAASEKGEVSLHETSI